MLASCYEPDFKVFKVDHFISFRISKLFLIALAIVRIRTMLAFKMFFNQRILEARSIGIYSLREKSHFSNGLQHGTMVDRLRRCLSPREGRMVANQYHFHFFVAEIALL